MAARQIAAICIAKTLVVSWFLVVARSKAILHVLQFAWCLLLGSLVCIHACHAIHEGAKSVCKATVDQLLFYTKPGIDFSQEDNAQKSPLMPQACLVQTAAVEGQCRAQCNTEK